MSLKPIKPQHFASNDVDPGTGVRIKNEAQSMNRYGSMHREVDTGRFATVGAGGGMLGYDDMDAQPPRDPKKTLVSIVAVVLVLVAMGIGLSIGIASCNNQLVDESVPNEVVIVIPAGYGAGDIAQLLQAKDVISSTTAFIQAVSAQGADNALKAGTYTFKTGLDCAEVVDALVLGPQASGLQVTIPEGLTVAQTMERVASILHVSYDELMAQAKASNYVAEFPFLEGAYADSLEGFLYPETYFFEETASADTVIRVMLNQFQVATSQLDWSLATQGGTSLTRYQVVVMASLIERETAVPDERPLVASVMFNRLNAGMMLQIDATIAYALNKTGLITYEDLLVDSPYNTYMSFGLCPGPICSPSLSSIEAVLGAAQTTYYYYVAAPALDGSHTFCSTSAEFDVAKAAYNQAMGIS